MAKKPTTTAKAADPIDILATGVAADHAAKKLADAKKPAEDETIVEPDNEAAREQVRVEAERPTKLDTPAAPGDDADSVLDRRIARLTTLAMEAEFESGTLFGDLRDLMLDQNKHQVKPWAQMTNSERNIVVKQCEAVAGIAIGKMALVLAQEGLDSVQGTLDKKWIVNGEVIELKIKLETIDNDTLIDVHKLGGHRVVIVSADSKRFMSARRSQDQGDDQISMGFETGTSVEQLKPSEPAKPTEPAAEVSDAALADGDDTASGVDKAKDAAAGDGPPADKGEGESDPVDKPFGVFDTTDAEWIKTVAVGDSADEWTADTAEALAMTSENAVKLAAEYGDGFEARRFDDEG